MHVKCTNHNCEYYSKKGCTLFAGLSWQTCRNAKTNTKPQPPKGQSK